MNAIDTVITDLEMLKNGSWIPDKDSCEASIRMLERAKTEFERMYSEEDIIEFSEWADISKESSDFWRKNRRSPTMDNSHHIYIREKRLELFQIWKEQFKKK